MSSSSSYRQPPISRAKRTEVLGFLKNETVGQITYCDLSLRDLGFLSLSLSGVFLFRVLLSCHFTDPLSAQPGQLVSFATQLNARDERRAPPRSLCGLVPLIYHRGGSSRAVGLLGKETLPAQALLASQSHSISCCHVAEHCRRPAWMSAALNLLEA